MKTRLIATLLILLLTGMSAYNQGTNPPPPPPPPTPDQTPQQQHLQIHLQHHQMHLQQHNEAHKNAVDATNRHHEEARRRHQESERQSHENAGMLAGNQAYGAGSSNHVMYRLPKRFKVGDMYYASTFRGLKEFMTDIQVENPFLYESMQPSYYSLKRKRNATIATVTAGTAIGTGLIVGGFTFLNNNERMFGPGDPFDGHNPKKPNVAIIAGGTGTLLLGAIVGWIIQPREEDIYNFVNLHNRNNPNQKMDWEIGLDMFQGNTPGLKLTLNF